MSKRRAAKSPSAKTLPERPREPQIVEVSVVDEMESSFLSYALSVITARALPDARDGLKPVQRRILYSLWSQRIVPSGPYKKSARVVGDTMARYHPHGDSSIYLSLCNLATGFSMRLPLVDPHGNFGSLDDSPAASRYTECRLAVAGLALIDGIDEDTVDFANNYDGTEREPVVLPAAFPNLLVNGTTGVAVGMTTSIPSHNLGEVVAAAKLLLADRSLSTDALLATLTGPDFAGGGEVVDLAEVHEAYRTGKGSFKIRAKASIVTLANRRRGIEVTELPHMVGPEKVIERVRQLVADKRLEGIASVVDLTDRSAKLRLVFEVKAGFDPAAVLAELYRTTPMEETFPVSFVALVDGRPKVCTLADLLGEYLDHRLVVVRRRTEHRLAKATARLHLVDGLLIALDAIDETVRIIRAAANAAVAKTALIEALSLSDEQATYILEMPLRRLTSLEVTKLRDEAKELTRTVKSLTAILASKKRLISIVADELDEAAAAYDTDRRTALAPSAPQPMTATLELDDTGPSPTRSAHQSSLEIPDVPALVGVTPDGEASVLVGALGKQRPTRHDRFAQVVDTTTRSTLVAFDAAGVAHPFEAHELPSTEPGAPGVALSALVDATGPVVALVPQGASVVLVTARGTVKRTMLEDRRGPTSYIKLADGDRVVAVARCADEADLVLVTRTGQLLRTEAGKIRPQGRTAAGVAGIRLDAADEVLYATAVVEVDDVDLVVCTDAGGVKATALGEYPRKGRATAGVRALRFRADEASLVAAAVGAGLVGSVSPAKQVMLPDRVRRDATANRLDVPVTGLVSLRP